MNGNLRRVRRPRRSPEQWAELVAGWVASDLSAAQYAERHGVGVHSLRSWASRLRERQERRQPSPPRVVVESGRPRFLAVEVRQPDEGTSGSVAARGHIEVAWPRGPVVRVSGEVSERTLAAVFGAIAEAAPC